MTSDDKKYVYVLDGSELFFIKGLCKISKSLSAQTIQVNIENLK